MKDTLASCAQDKGDALKLVPQHPPGGLGSSLVTLPPSGSKLTAQELNEVGVLVFEAW